MSEPQQAPRSPRDEVDGIVYFPRLCDKVRLHAAGTLSPDYHANLGSGMDLWTCQFLGVNYAPLADQIRARWVNEAAPKLETAAR